MPCRCEPDAGNQVPSAASAEPPVPADHTHSRFIAGPNAFCPLSEPIVPEFEPFNPTNLEQMVVASFPDARRMRGQRGEREVPEMMQSWCSCGMWMMGDPGSPTNRIIIPAINFIYSHIARLSPSEPQRVSIVKTLAYACEDCQGVQAREIMRIFSDLTSYTRDLPHQVLYFLSKYKVSTTSVSD